MDPDYGAAFDAASQFAKTTVITVAIITLSAYPTETSSDPSIAIKSPGKKDLHTFSKKIRKHDKKKRTLYLSFDDGPNRGTKNVMRMAKQEEVPVTFFIVGEHVYGTEWQQEIWDSLQVCDMAELANHSYSHAHHRYEAFYNEPDSVVGDFERCRDSLHFTSNISRTPGRNIWRTGNITSTDIRSSKPAADSLKDANFSLVGWDLEWHYDGRSLQLSEPGDSLLNKIDSAFAKKQTKTPDHLVLLAHDQAYADAGDSSVLHNFFIRLRNEGKYNLEFISNYPGVANK